MVTHPLEAVRRAAGRLYGPLRERFHGERARAFVELARPAPGSRVLDLGGGDGSFAERISGLVDIDVVVAEPEADTRARAAERGFEAVEVQPGERLPFAEDAFDLVLCNSVIEHATTWRGAGPARGRGDGAGRTRGEAGADGDPSHADHATPWGVRAAEAQRRFAGEIRRVGRGYFVQTPHADFPVDAHLWLPGTNWLPHAVLERLVPVTDRVWIKRCGVADWRLLRVRDMAALFPDGEIRVERALGLPKSIIAVKPAGGGARG